MLLIKTALVVLIAWTIWEKKKTSIINLYKSIKKWIDAIRPSAVYIDTGHANRRAENTHHFYRKLEMFSRTSGIEYKVWEDFKVDGLVVRLYDPKTNLAWQTLIKREEYEEDPITCMYNIRTSWRKALKKSCKEEE